MEEYFEKTKETPSGYTADCWVATKIEIDLTHGNGYIRMHGYKDHASKLAGREKIAVVDLLIPNILSMVSALTVKADVVNFIPASEEFAGAVFHQVE
jgi:hypothetical protein